MKYMKLRKKSDKQSQWKFTKKTNKMMKKNKNNID